VPIDTNPVALGMKLGGVILDKYNSIPPIMKVVRFAASSHVHISLFTFFSPSIVLLRPSSGLFSGIKARRPFSVYFRLAVIWN
jgi:hypothetical protein